MKGKKIVSWEGNTYKDLLGCPLVVREAFVQDIELLSYGLKPLSRAKSMQGLGRGVIELIRNGRPAYRCVYRVEGDTIYILHVFSKTSDGTDKKHENTIKIRLKSVKS